MHRARSFCASALLALALTGCSCSDDPSGTPCAADSECGAGEVCVDGLCETGADAGPGMDGGPGSDAGAGGRRDTGPEPDGGPSVPDTGAPDAACGGEAVPFDYEPPNVLIIFDRSCSMRRLLAGVDFGTGPEDTGTRWNVARSAVLGMLDRFGSRAFWGLMAFPDPREGCDEPVDAEVAPGPGTRAAIETALMSTDVQPFGLCGLDNTDTTTQPRQTPTEDALASAMGLTGFAGGGRDAFAIVVTDGGVSCGVTDGELSTLTAALRDAGIPVGVIGFATGAAEGSLEAIAAAGGLANPAGPPSYYVAEDRTDLDAVLDEIAARVVSCDFPLASTPPDPSMLFVNVNDAPLAMDATDGWSYEAGTNTLRFNGAVCDRLRSGDVRRIAISFGCAPVACVPRAETCNGLDDDCDDAVDEDCLM